MRITQPPRALRQARLDNLALVPGSLLPFKAKYQELANNLPKDSVLIILPGANKPQRMAVERVVSLLEARGHQVTTLPAEQFG